MFESPSGAIEDEPLFWEIRGYRPSWGDPVDHLSPNPPLLGVGRDFSVLTADGRWRLTKETNRIGLFDLVEDPTGHVNVFDEHPDQVEEMIAMYQTWSEEMRLSREGILSESIEK